MTDAECQHAIRERVDRLLVELRAVAESDPERLSRVDFMVLAIHAVGAAACRGRTVTLDPAQGSILVDGAVELLTDWAAGEVDSGSGEFRREHNRLDERLLDLEIAFAAVERQRAGGGGQDPQSDRAGPTA